MPHIDLAEYQRIEPALLYELDLAFFEDRYEDAPPTEQLVLEAMARQMGPVTLRRLRAQLDDLAGLDLLVRRLVERGLVYRTGRATYGLRPAAVPQVHPAAPRTYKTYRICKKRSTG